jgi:hypothetical protein
VSDPELELLISNNKFTDSMSDQLFFIIYRETLGDIIYKQFELERGNGCLDRGRYLGN